MKTAEELITFIHPYLNLSIESFEEIKEGFSDDLKIKLNTKDQNYLLRIGSIENKDRRKEEFDMMDALLKLGVSCNQPVLIGSIPEIQISYTLFSFLEGESAEKGLSEVSSEAAFHIGEKAGQDLKKMNELQPDHLVSPWSDRLTKKFERYKIAYKKGEYSFSQDSYLLNLVERELSGLKGTENFFQHDDFHVGNIIIQNDQYVGVIDFNRMDWGDPYHDFIKVGWFSRKVSIDFCRGQLEGYFAGNIPSEFWDRYRLYLAISVFSTIVWHQNYFPHLMNQAHELLQMILEDHKGFRKKIPKWW